MASTFFGLSISYTGLQAAATSINVTGHNISNINTPGFTRQQAVAQASDALRTYSTYGSLGSGVELLSIEQIRDSYYDVKYRNNQANLGEYEVKNSYMEQIQGYLNEFSLNGYSKEYENFFTAVNQLKLTPGEESAKNQLINNAKSLTDYFNTLTTNMRNIQVDINNEIKDAVDKINTLASNITELNRQINQVETNYGNANDLRDQRNSLIDDLSKLANIDVNEQKSSENTTELNITINGQPLVSGYMQNKLETVARDEKRNVSDAPGLYDIRWENGQDFYIYSNTLSGSLKGLIDIRDGCNGEIEDYTKDNNGEYVKDEDGNLSFATHNQAEKNTTFKGVPYYQAQFNQFFQTFANEVNDILTSGYTHDSEKGIALFVPSDGTNTLAAGTITVNKELLNDSNKLAVKSDVTYGQAQCDIIDKLYDLKNEKIFDGGTGTYFLESMVSDMSIDASNSENMEKNYSNLSLTIHNQRLSIMGVDTEEEAMGLIQYQQAYNLNSKLLSIMNEIYDKLINQTGV